VAWCESSAVNYGNSVLGIRTNRYGAGMEMVCAMLGKAPEFGLMTDEGRKAKWLIDVKTSQEPDWGTLGTAIGRKVVEDIPYIAGVEQQAVIDTFENWYETTDAGLKSDPRRNEITESSTPRTAFVAKVRRFQ